jgi:redox-sensitive bicupin YhaK (pirin superfamily)
MATTRRELLLGGSAALVTACARRPAREDAMITLRRANDRFHTDFGWLDSRHTFAFGEHWDPRHAGFRNLRVINDDRVAAGGGFPMHPHKDMEIISYVLDGGLAHEDSMGNGSVIRPGDVQRMSAGTGVRHSEFNPEKERATHFLQIWLLPSEKGIRPSYEQQRFTDEEKGRGFRLVASPDGREGSVKITADAALRVARLEPGQEREVALPKGRHGWVHVATGAIELNGQRLAAGDGAAISDEGALRFTGLEAGEVLLFDLA